MMSKGVKSNASNDDDERKVGRSEPMSFLPSICVKNTSLLDLGEHCVGRYTPPLDFRKHCVGCINCSFEAFMEEIRNFACCEYK